MPFTQPAASGGYLRPADLVGHLVLIREVTKIERVYDSLRGGEIDQATVDYVDLDGDAVLEEDVFVTHPGIVNKLRQGQTDVLGRVGSVTTKKGHDAYVLEPYRPGSDDARAQQWIDEQAKGRFAQPIQDLKPQPRENGVDPAMLAAALANLTPEQRAQLNL